MGDLVGWEARDDSQFFTCVAGNALGVSGFVDLAGG
jgi:hypothetical protein